MDLLATAWPFALFAVYLALFAIGTLLFIHQRQRVTHAAYFFLIGVSFFFAGYGHLLDALGLASFPPALAIVQTFFWAVLFSLVIASLSRLRRLTSLTYLTLGAAILTYAVIGKDFVAVLPFLAYYLAAISFFVLYSLTERPLQHAGFFGLLAVFLFTFIALLSPTVPELVIVPLLLLAVSFSFFLRHGLTFDRLAPQPKLTEGTGVWKSFAFLLSYIILLNLAVFTTGIGLHEAGHLVVGNLIGCTGGKIVLVDLTIATPGPYTEISCPRDVFTAFLALSGYPFVVIFGAIFLLLRRFPERNFGLVLFGLSLTLSGVDLLLLTSSLLLIYGLMLVGTVTIMLGEMRLINDYLTPSARPMQAAAAAKKAETPVDL